MTGTTTGRQSTIDAVLAYLDAPDFAVSSPVMFTAWVRRPDFAILTHADAISDLGDRS